MKNSSYIILLFGLFLLFSCGENQNSINTDSGVDHQSVEELNYTSDEQMQRFFDNHAEKQQVFIAATVIKNLPDDNEGSRHQKFLVELSSGQTLLISHNIDLADRIENIEEGDEVKIFGQYEWNERGGVVHWTHHDPDGSHVGGWIEHGDKFYE